MAHLSPEQLVDVAEGMRAEASLPHLASCAECRGGVAGLQLTMTRIEEDDLPEPSPLFWEHFSARVHDAIAAEPAVMNGAHSLLGQIAGLRWAAYVLAACAAVLMAAAITIWTRQPAVGVPAPVRDAPIATEAADVTLVPPDDPALDLVADLGSALDWQQIHDAGVVAHAGLVDRAVTGLSADERVELGRLLKQELRGGGN